MKILEVAVVDESLWLPPLHFLLLMEEVLRGLASISHQISGLAISYCALRDFPRASLCLRIACFQPTRRASPQSSSGRAAVFVAGMGGNLYARDLYFSVISEIIMFCCIYQR